MMSTGMRAANALAEEYDKGLLATDPRFRGLVIVRGEHDGSCFVYPDAFVVKKDEWYVVFTEHYGFHVYHSEDNNARAYSTRETIESAPF